MITLRNDEDMQNWLADSTQASVLLLWRNGQEASLDAFEALEFPRGWNRASVEIDAAPTTGQRLAIHESPAVAVLYRDCLLAVEYGCDDACGERVVRWAQHQIREFLIA